MTVDPGKVASFEIAPYERGHAADDSVLYHLGLGLGHDPVDRNVLPFVYQDWGPRVLPTFATVIGDSNHWLSDPALGLGAAPNVHGDETITLHAPIPAEGTIKGQSRVVGLYDRGSGSHAILVIEEEMVDADSGQALATLRQTDVLIGAGGFGGPPPPVPERAAMPDREPDAIHEQPVAAQAALIYRLSGDHYALHVEPKFARDAGFDGPILHGLATYGIACHAVVACCCDHEPERVQRFHGRFSAPVYPGDRLRTLIWRDGSAVWFETRAAGRDIVVLANGRADLKGHAGGH
ncbi:MAG: MaoC/PaaZ C-terminal domain-containing protein [Pseudomonadota bacterium]